MNRLLRKKDVTEAVDAPKTTVNDWINEFKVFIPIVREGRSTYYKPAAIDVLLAIKEMRENGLDKTQIALELPNRGFAMDADEIVKDVAKIQNRAMEKAEQTRNRDALLTVMQSLGVAMERMAELERAFQESTGRTVEQERINKELTERIVQQSATLEQQEMKIAEIQHQFDVAEAVRTDIERAKDEMIEETQRILHETRNQLAASEEAAKAMVTEEIKNPEPRGFFARLFGR